MTDQSILLQLPEAIYSRARQVAQDSHRPLENVLIESLSLLFGDLPDAASTDLEVLNTFSEEQLWAIVYRPLDSIQDARLKELTALAQVTPLSDAQRGELERLVDQVDRYVLLRSQALLLLKQRGYLIEKSSLTNR